MDPEGFELVRSPLVRVDLLNVFKNKNGPRGIRTVRSHQLKQFEPLYQRKSTFRGALLVDPGGFEPPTFSMPLRRAPSCAMVPLSRFLPGRRLWSCPSGASRLMMDLEGFEPSTSSVRLKRAPNCATGPTIAQNFRAKKFYLSGG